MITIMLHLTVKKNKLDDFKQVAASLTTTARNNPDCIHYSFNQQQNNPYQFILHEQWHNQTALENHIQNLITLFGPPDPGEQLPAKLIDFYESTEITYYDTIEADT